MVEEAEEAGLQSLAAAVEEVVVEGRAWRSLFFSVGVDVGRWVKG